MPEAFVTQGMRRRPTIGKLATRFKVSREKVAVLLVADVRHSAIPPFAGREPATVAESPAPKLPPVDSAICRRNQQTRRSRAASLSLSGSAVRRPRPRGPYRNPADPHVQVKGPHLNLERHIDGSQVFNRHHAIDGSTVRSGDHP